MSADKKDLEPDAVDDTPDEATDGVDAARRRRRRAGLRVPSDNVPRPQARAAADGPRPPNGEVEVDIDLADDTRPTEADEELDDVDVDLDEETQQFVPPAPNGSPRAADSNPVVPMPVVPTRATTAPIMASVASPPAPWTVPPAGASATADGGSAMSSGTPPSGSPAATSASPAPVLAAAPGELASPASAAVAVASPAVIVAPAAPAANPSAAPVFARAATPVPTAPPSATVAPAADAIESGWDLPPAAAGPAADAPKTLVTPVPSFPEEQAASSDRGDGVPNEDGEELSSMELEEVDSGPVIADPAKLDRGAKGGAAVATASAAAQPAASADAGGAQAGRSKKRRGKAWFEEIFDEDYLRTLPFLTPQSTQREAAFVTESLGLSAGAHMLDVGCGYGRHAMELAARGYRVSGLDLSLPLLIRGADEAQRRGLSINFVHGDMRELSFDAQFDGAYCLFSTFGYFDDEANKKVASNIARALKPGARFLVEILNRDYIIADLPTRVWWEGDGCVVLEEVDFNYYTSRVVTNRSVVFEDGRQLEQEISVRTYALHELGKLLHGVGFRVLEVSGAIATRGRYFGKDSRQLLVLAERRADLPSNP